MALIISFSHTCFETRQMAMIKAGHKTGDKVGSRACYLCLLCGLHMRLFFCYNVKCSILRMRDYLQCKIIGARVSKPHTSQSNCNFLYWQTSFRMLFGAVIAAGHMQIIRFSYNMILWKQAQPQATSCKVSLKDDAYEGQPGRAAGACIPDYYCTSQARSQDFLKGGYVDV